MIYYQTVNDIHLGIAVKIWHTTARILTYLNLTEKTCFILVCVCVYVFWCLSLFILESRSHHRFLLFTHLRCRMTYGLRELRPTNWAVQSATVRERPWGNRLGSVGSLHDLRWRVCQVLMHMYIFIFRICTYIYISIHIYIYIYSL